MTREELKQAALSLPYEPGVYLMKNAAGTVIYVGKAKKLKNRVSQYFQDTAAHNAKTRKMVSNVDHFETIAAATEFEALVLECSLIKHYMPKYNILLKDDKGYPYLRVDLREDYPVITLATRVTDDGARYFGPYGSRGRTQQVIDALAYDVPPAGLLQEIPARHRQGTALPELSDGPLRRLVQALHAAGGLSRAAGAGRPSARGQAPEPVSGATGEDGGRGRGAAL